MEKQLDKLVCENIKFNSFARAKAFYMSEKVNFHPTEINLGILGGGQLGKMLAIAAAPWHLPLRILDQSKTFPAAPFSHFFMEGSFKEYEDVLSFGKTCDYLTIEIEHVNVEALFQLEKEGKVIHPRPHALQIIKDKGLQKEFYKKKNLPTAAFHLVANESAIKIALEAGKIHYPFVQKTRTAGYDGKGVAVIKNESALDKLLPGPSVIEPLVDIAKELAVIVARNGQGQIEAFPPVEMIFNPTANLVEFLLCPAKADPLILKQAINLAKTTIEAYDICGLLAVELFLTKDQEILINEVAPRPHNSGHHTIESCFTSQFEQHLRGVLNLPLGSTQVKIPSVMLNLLGHPGHSGKAVYQGLEECLAMEGVKIHLYGKTMTKPFRKMGHVTVLNEDVEQALSIAKKVKEKLKVIAE